MTHAEVSKAGRRHMLTLYGRCADCAETRRKGDDIPEADYKAWHAMWDAIEACNCAITMHRAPTRREAVIAYCAQCDLAIAGGLYWDVRQSAHLHETGCAQPRITYWR